jgi:tRNA(Ile)-lysidine synthase
MASSRRSLPPADAVAPVQDAVRRALACHRGARVAIALSGGRDSMALLDAACCVAPELGVSLAVVHVHHGLSANADAWSAFCAQECARRGIALDVRRVAVAFVAQDGVEAAARRARYAALASVDADAVATAHHADDQAETLLLQLLRGAGPHGLAAMPASRVRAGVALVRPLLGLPRAALERYAAARGLAWVDDESNDDRARTRNLVRHALAPKLADAFAGYPSSLVRAAALQAEYAQLADDLAERDAEGAIEDGALARERLASLAPHRARNLLRWHLRSRGLRAPSAARLSSMLDQLVHASADARVRLRHDGAEIGLHRGFIVVHAPPVAPYAVAWRGEREVALPHGTLEFAPSIGEGIAAEALRARDVVVRSREGGERIRLAPRGARQALKHLLQRAGVPHWARPGVPLVCCDGALAAVPGIGVDAAFAAAARAPAYALVWRPRPQR